MIKNNKRKAIVSTLVLLLPILAGLILWNRLPERIPIHWNTAGEIDGWSGKPFAVLGVPCFLLAVHWLCLIATSLDPKAQNHSPKLYGLVFLICPVMSVLISAMTYATALGISVPVPAVMMLMCGLLFVVLGNYLPKCKYNYTIGIRIMWTLNSEANWNATHRFAGKIWVVGGLLVIASAFLPQNVMFFPMIAVTAALAIVPIAYSYLYYRKHGEK